MNLLKETEEILKENGLALEDIDWVGCRLFRIPVDAFIEAADTRYDEGFGAPKVAEDLIVVLKDGSWLEREEHDGSEWWEFKNHPHMPSAVWDGAVAVTVDQVDCSSVGWECLARLCALADGGDA